MRRATQYSAIRISQNERSELSTAPYCACAQYISPLLSVSSLYNPEFPWQFQNTMEMIGHISFKKIPRILIAKCGLDGHDRGAKFIAKALRDAGMEIIYTGIRQTPLDIARTAVQEDVDLVGLSILSGAHNTLFPKLIEALKEQGAPDIPVFGGGVIPESDIPSLKEMGVKAIFTPGASVQSVIEEIKKILEE